MQCSESSGAHSDGGNNTKEKGPDWTARHSSVQEKLPGGLPAGPNTQYHDKYSHTPDSDRSGRGQGKWHEDGNLMGDHGGIRSLRGVATARRY